MFSVRLGDHDEDDHDEDGKDHNDHGDLTMMITTTATTTKTAKTTTSMTMTTTTITCCTAGPGKFIARSIRRVSSGSVDAKAVAEDASAILEDLFAGRTDELRGVAAIGQTNRCHVAFFFGWLPLVGAWCPPIIAQSRLGSDE